MLRLPLTTRRVVFVEIQPDNGINKGGFYCQVYEDENGKYEHDGFTISKNEIPPSVTDTEERRKKAISIAYVKAKRLFA